MGNELSSQVDRDEIEAGLTREHIDEDSGHISPHNKDQVAKELGDLLSTIRSKIKLPKIPVDTEQLSERAKKRLTRRAFRNNNFISFLMVRNMA